MFEVKGWENRLPVISGNPFPDTAAKPRFVSAHEESCSIQRMAVIPNECEGSRSSDEPHAPEQESRRSVEIPRYTLLRNSVRSSAEVGLTQQALAQLLCHPEQVTATLSPLHWKETHPPVFRESCSRNWGVSFAGVSGFEERARPFEYGTNAVVAPEIPKLTIVIMRRCVC